MIDENQLVLKYRRFIASVVRRRVSRYNLKNIQSELEDIMSESTFAFVLRVREIAPEALELTPYELGCCRRKIEYVVRAYIWKKVFHETDIHKTRRAACELLCDFTQNEDCAVYDFDTTAVEVDAFLKTLTPRDRKIVRMRMDGKSEDTVADELNISQQAVAKRLVGIRNRYADFALERSERKTEHGRHTKQTDGQSGSDP